MQHYVKTRSRATMKGEWYEVKVAALLYLRSMNNDQVTHYQLMTNLDGAAALDDIAHRAKYKDDPDTWHTSFIQLKHKEKARLGVKFFTSPKGDFSLMKYKDAFIEIRKSKQDNDYENRWVFDGSFDHFQFVIYTNSKINPHSFASSLIKPGSLEELLKSDCDNELIFKFDRERNKEVFAFLEEDEKTRADAAEFLEKLTVFSGQPMESDLDDMIKKELLIACGGQVSDARPVYRIFEGLFKEWWRDSNVVLDETSDILQRAIDQLSAEAELTKQTEKCTLDLNFDEKLWTSFNTGFSEGVSLLHVVTTSGSLRLSATKVLRLLHAERLSFTFISLDYLLQHQQMLISDWREGYKDCLVIVCDCNEIPGQEQIVSLGNDIQNVLELPNKKSILVSCMVCQLATKLSDCNQDRYKQVEDIIFDLTHLDQACQTKIFGAKLSFQNHELAFKSLYDRDFKFWESFLCDDLTERLLSQHLIAIGKQLPCVVEYYIPRRLKRHIVVSPDMFKPGNCKDQIAVSGVTMQVLKAQLDHEVKILLASQVLDAPSNERNKEGSDPYSRILVLDKDKTVEEFNALCRLKPTVHWLHMEDGVLSWKMSKGAMSNVKQFIDETKPSIIQSESVMASDDRMNIIIAEPGMGKTTLMACLARGVKQANPADWVIVINLRDHSELFNQSQQLSALDFLTSALHLDSPLEKAFLRESLEETGNIIVLLDSFDEISPKYEQEGRDLLTSILKTRVKKVVVTSRHCMQGKLETHFLTIPYNIIEFSVEDQKMFFRKFWSQSSTPMSSDELEVFISTLIDSVNAIDKEKRLLGIPLQTMMLAEVFDDHVTDPEHNKFPQKLDMIDLFEQFVEKKFLIFHKKGNNNLNKEDSRIKFLLEHMHAALKLLIHENDISTLHSEVNIDRKANKFLKNIEEARDNSGLVIKVVGKRPIFLHQMFAEYLAALWFAEHFALNRDFLKESLFEPNYNVILIMFDRILCKGHQLHEAVLDMDMVRVETLLAVEGVDVNSRDLGGRTALHLAAAVGFEFDYNTQLDYISYPNHRREYIRTDCPRPLHMVEHLIVYGANVNLTDNVLEWSPLEYALKTTTWDAMEYLLENEADTNLMSEICQEIEYLRSNWSVKPLFLLSRSTEIRPTNVLEGVLLYGFANILELVFQKGLPVDLQTGGITVLQLASSIGHVKCVEVLLSRGANKQAQEYETCAKVTPLHLASEFGHLPVVRALIEDTSQPYREYVNIRNNHCGSALHFARTSEICLYLIEQDADLWSRDEKNRTCLHTASWEGRLSVVETLIERVGSTRDEKLKFVDAPDSSDVSAIMLAIDGGHADIVRYLIAHGADVWQRDKEGKTCLHKVGSVEVARLIIERMGDDKDKVKQHVNTLSINCDSALAIAAIRGLTEVVNLFISLGADVWPRNSVGRTCLHYARSLEVARDIIKCLGDDKDALTTYINIRDIDSSSAVARALHGGYTEVVDLLFSLKAEVWPRDKWGRTCLHLARSGEVARAIIKRLGDDEITIYINAPNNEGVTALAEASRVGCTEIVDLLVSLKADVWSRDKKGRTCLHAAAHVCNLSVAQSLIGSLGDDKAAIVKFINARDNDFRTARKLIVTGSLFPWKLKLHSDFLDWLDTTLAMNVEGPDPVCHPPSF